jgi:hypothetical protein
LKESVRLRWSLEKKYNIRFVDVPQPKQFIFVGSEIMNNQKVYLVRTAANENVQLFSFTLRDWRNGIIITDNVIGGRRRRRSTNRRRSRKN